MYFVAYSQYLILPSPHNRSQDVISGLFFSLAQLFFLQNMSSLLDSLFGGKDNLKTQGGPLFGNRNKVRI